MFNLSNIIFNFIETPKSDYSILISGKWGAGKTYYIKNILFKELENKQCEPIYVSLNGVSDLSLVDREIFYNKFLGKKYKKFSGVFNTCIEFAKQIDQKVGAAVGLLSKFKSKFDQHAFDNLNFDKNIIFMDDIERISDKICVSEVLGHFYTKYVENLCVRVVFIGNEDEIKENLKYKIIKEKFIRYTVVFEPNKAGIIDEVVKNSVLIYHKTVIKTISNNKERLLKLFREEHNLRTLFFVFDVYNTVVKSCALGEKQEELYNVNDEVFMFIVILSLEYKNGNTTTIFDDSLFYKSPFSYIFVDSTNINRTKLREELFQEKYKIENELPYKFFLSIYRFITEGYFSVEDFKEEVNDYIKIGSKAWYILFENLQHNFKKIEQKELENSVKSLLNYVKEFKYDFKKYPQIYFLLKLIEKRGYLKKNPKYDVKLFINALKKTRLPKQEEKRNILNYFGFFDKEIVEGDVDLKKIIEAGEKLILKGEENSVINKINSFWDNLSCADYKDYYRCYEQFFLPLFIVSFFKYSKNSKTLKKILKFNNFGLSRVEEILNNNFNSVSNAGTLFNKDGELSQIMNWFANEIENYIQTKKQKTMKIKRLEELALCFKLTSKHLEGI